MKHPCELFSHGAAGKWEDIAEEYWHIWPCWCLSVTLGHSFLLVRVSGLAESNSLESEIHVRQVFHWPHLWSQYSAVWIRIICLLYMWFIMQIYIYKFIHIFYIYMFASHAQKPNFYWNQLYILSLKMKMHWKHKTTKLFHLKFEKTKVKSFKLLFGQDESGVFGCLCQQPIFRAM